MPRSSNVDVDWAVQQLVNEVESQLSDSQVCGTLPPCSTGANSVKKRFAVGAKTAETIYHKAQESLEIAGLHKFHAGGKLCLYFRSEADALGFPGLELRKNWMKANWEVGEAAPAAGSHKKPSHAMHFKTLFRY